MTPLGTLAALEARIRALEAQLADGNAGSEAISPSYLNVGSSGLVQAVFPGGVEIPEPVSSNAQWTAPSVGSSVHWTSGSTPVSYVGDVLQLGVRRLTLWLDATTSATGGQIEARIGPVLGQKIRTIVDQAGNSSFWQKANAAGAAETSDAFAIAGPFQVTFTNIATVATASSVVTTNLAWATQYPIGMVASAGNPNFTAAFSNPAAPMNNITIAVRNNATTTQTATIFFWLIGHP